MVNLNIVAGPQIGVSVGSQITTTGGDITQPNAVLSVKKAIWALLTAPDLISALVNPALPVFL